MEIWYLCYVAHSMSWADATPIQASCAADAAEKYYASLQDESYSDLNIIVVSADQAARTLFHVSANIHVTYKVEQILPEKQIEE